MVPECVVSELSGLSSNIPDAVPARLLADRFERVPSMGKGDQCVMDAAVELGAFVLTNDRKFIVMLKEAGIRVLSIRRGRKIEFV